MMLQTKIVVSIFYEFQQQSIVKTEVQRDYLKRIVRRKNAFSYFLLSIFAKIAKNHVKIARAKSSNMKMWKIFP